ncbi:hypothetical protein M0R04_14895 [Candidatus Dojkabacteria bacterium]|jgi:hypothetical protein|nr:hypothetical protein [Candidatus Dojkabacteria bacterium]
MTKIEKIRNAIQYFKEDGAVMMWVVRDIKQHLDKIRALPKADRQVGYDILMEQPIKGFDEGDMYVLFHQLYKDYQSDATLREVELLMNWCGVDDFQINLLIHPELRYTSSIL